MVDDGFHVDGLEGADCVVNPDKCNDGLSFSLFYYAQYKESEEELYDKTKTFEKEYIISTGSFSCCCCYFATTINYCTYVGGEEGTPGFSIYRKGANLGALVSTGNLTWELEVVGSAPQNNTWSNLAIRWIKPTVDTPEKYVEAVKNKKTEEEIGGLQLFLNTKPHGHLIFPEVHGCPYDKATAQYNCMDPMPDIEEEFNPPQMMMGCHRTKKDPTPRMFSGGRFDELAIWIRQIKDEELPLFMGGYRKFCH